MELITWVFFILWILVAIISLGRAFVEGEKEKVIEYYMAFIINALYAIWVYFVMKALEYL